MLIPTVLFVALMIIFGKSQDTRALNQKLAREREERQRQIRLDRRGS